MRSHKAYSFEDETRSCKGMACEGGGAQRHNGPCGAVMQSNAKLQAAPLPSRSAPLATYRSSESAASLNNSYDRICLAGSKI